MTPKTYTFADMDSGPEPEKNSAPTVQPEVAPEPEPQVQPAPAKKAAPTAESRSAPPASAPIPKDGPVADDRDDTRADGAREFANPRRHPVVAGLAALCVAAIIATAVLATLFVQRSSDLDSARTLAADKATAETDAGKYAVGAATFDFTNLDSWTAALKRGTAPELSSRFDVAAKTLTPLLQEVQWKQTANLIAAKTIDIRDGRQFVVQVFVSTRMTSTQNPTGLNTVTPYTVTLDRNDNWTITDVAGIDGTPQDKSTGTGVPNLGPDAAGAAPTTPSAAPPPPS